MYSDQLFVIYDTSFSRSSVEGISIPQLGDKLIDGQPLDMCPLCKVHKLSFLQQFSAYFLATNIKSSWRRDDRSQ